MGKPQPINISTLGLQDLQQLAKLIAEERTALERNVGVLKQLAASWHSSGAAVSELNEMQTGQAMMVPLTESLYVPGILHDSDNVVVDIGTGYYVEKSCKEAGEFCDRKIDYIKQQLDTIGERIKEKTHALQQIETVFRQKMAASSQQAQASSQLSGDSS